MLTGRPAVAGGGRALGLDVGVTGFRAYYCEADWAAGGGAHADREAGFGLGQQGGARPRGRADGQLEARKSVQQHHVRQVGQPAGPLPFCDTAVF